MFAIRLYIQAVRPSYSPSDDINPFRSLYQKKIMLAFPEDQKILRADDYTAILNKFVIPCRYARGALSEHLSSLVCGGEAVALDERMHPWKGKGPCVRSIPSKPNSIGLWTTQMCIRTSSKTPYCCGMFPFDQDVKHGETIHLEDVANWASALLKYKEIRKPILVTDSYYFSAGSHLVFQENRQPYLSSVQSNRMKSIVAELESRVNNHGSFAGAHNTATGEVVVHYWCADERIGRRTVYSNAFRHIPWQDQPVTRAPLWGEYKELFNSCDRFNLLMSRHKYPFIRKHYTHCFDDVFVTSMYLNVFSVCKELGLVSDAVSFREFGTKLALDVIAMLNSR